MTLDDSVHPFVGGAHMESNPALFRVRSPSSGSVASRKPSCGAHGLEFFPAKRQLGDQFRPRANKRGQLRRGLAISDPLPQVATKQRDHYCDAGWDRSLDGEMGVGCSQFATNIGCPPTQQVVGASFGQDRGHIAAAWWGCPSPCTLQELVDVAGADPKGSGDPALRIAGIGHL